MKDVFDNMTVCVADVFCKKEYELLEEKWKFGITLKPKLRTYIKYKNNLQAENYVIYCNSREKGPLIAQFRTGTLPLAVETGRYITEV